MSNTFYAFSPDVISEIEDERGNGRWAVLIGHPGQPLFDYLRDGLLSHPGSRRLKMVQIDHTEPKVGPFLEQHMISSTPSILLVRRGKQEAFISGAIPWSRLATAIDELCSERTQDRLADALAELVEDNEKTVDDGEPFVKIGVSPEGFPIYAKKSDVDAGEAPSV